MVVSDAIGLVVVTATGSGVVVKIIVGTLVEVGESIDIGVWLGAGSEAFSEVLTG